jgi:hypothetical protein
MVFFGLDRRLAGSDLGEVVEFFATRVQVEPHG